MDNCLLRDLLNAVDAMQLHYHRAGALPDLPAPDLMTRDEIEWLNAYNALVAETLCPLLPDTIAQWLQLKCAPLRP